MNVWKKKNCNRKKECDDEIKFVFIENFPNEVGTVLQTHFETISETIEPIQKLLEKS